jgi:hypothetical protein
LGHLFAKAGGDVDHMVQHSRFFCIVQDGKSFISLLHLYMFNRNCLVVIRHVSLI